MAEKTQITNPVKVIRRYCLECCLESPKEVELCPAEGCWLHPFRMGTNPFRSERTEAQKAAARENMEKLQLARKSRETAEEKMMNKQTCIHTPLARHDGGPRV